MVDFYSRQDASSAPRPLINKQSNFYRTFLSTIRALHSVRFRITVWGGYTAHQYSGKFGGKIEPYTHAAKFYTSSSFPPSGCVKAQTREAAVEAAFYPFAGVCGRLPFVTPSFFREIKTSTHTHIHNSNQSSKRCRSPKWG